MQKQAYEIVDANGRERMVLTGYYHDNHARDAFVDLLETEFKAAGGENDFKIECFFYLGLVNLRPDLRAAA